MRDLSDGVQDGLGPNPADGQVSPGASNAPFTGQDHLSSWSQMFGSVSCNPPDAAGQ